MKDSDKITVVDSVLGAVTGAENGVFHATVAGPTFYNKKSHLQTFRWVCGQLWGWTGEDEEHIVWIRGHHEPDSTEVVALIAARALA